MKLKFENNQFKMGEISSQQVIDFEFPFEGKVEDIQWTKVSCGGCTQLTKLEDGILKGQFKTVFGGGAEFTGSAKPLQGKWIQICEVSDEQEHYGDGPVKTKRKNDKKVIHTLLLTGMITSK